MSQQTGLLLGEALRTISVFSDLNDTQIAWLTDHMEEVHFNQGDVLIRPGDPADHMIVMLEGEFEAFNPTGEPTGFIGSAGHVGGMLPGSRLTNYPGKGIATKPIWMARLHKDLFWRMFEQMPVLAPRLISILTDRVRRATRQEQQREKLAALGKISAGLAHELNNPASAVRQGVASMREAVGGLQKASIRLSKQQKLTQEQKAAFFEAERQAIECLGTRTLDPIEQSDCEQQMGDWLESHGVEEPWQLAPILVEGCLNEEKLDALLANLPDGIACDALLHMGAILTLEQLLRELETSAGRISELVRAIKEYSYMDQAADQEIDIHRGLDSTLTILGHKLKRGVNVIREYDISLPMICARGSELNQVWTNLVDNSIAAMNGNGEIRIRTHRRGDWVMVDIIDNGPGIPANLQARVFEPFFTTKDVGEGTGLGLETVRRIVQDHRGDVRFESEPGRTMFQVRLPIARPIVNSSDANQG